jgi:SNF2 family DNA or RNA helicase
MLSPSAMEIFQAVFGRVREIQGHQVDAPPSVDLPHLSFSRYPAEPAIRVFGSGIRLFVEAGVVTESGFVGISGDADQIISNNRWYPVQASAAQSTRQWIASAGARDGQPLTIGMLVAIRTGFNRPAKLIDEVLTTSDSIAASATSMSELVLGLDATLYPYQAGGVAFLRLISEQGVGCILADEMGLGKTLQVIALLQIEKNSGRHPSLVVAPATLLENWRRELAQFAPGLSVHVHAGAARPGIAAKLSGFDVTLVSYETAIRDETLLSAIRWNVVTLDEAQNIKNPSAQRTLAVKRLPRRVSIAVTGTPVENRLTDLWSVADFSLPGLLGDLDAFEKEFGDGVFDASRLAPLVTPLLLRRRVTDVAKDLPEKIEIPQPLTMSRALAEGYESLRKAILDEHGPAGGLVATTKLRTYCAHPSLPTSWDSDPSFEMPKYTRMLEILEEVFSAGEKALIFSTYQGMVDLFMSDIPRRFTTGFFRYIDGRVDVSSRQSTVDAFFSYSGYGALFLNPKAAGTGLNITAANHVIHYNPEWNPALTDQASGRAYRRKQQRPVTIHHLFFVSTVEEVIMERAGFKRQLAGEAVTGHEGEVNPIDLARALQISPLARLDGVE